VVVFYTVIYSLWVEFVVAVVQDQSLQAGLFRRRKMPSYMPNMMAALGTVRSRWGVMPP
jgi:hypothetical protein